MTGQVVVGGHGLTCEDVVSVARRGARVTMAADVAARLERERRVVDDIVDRQVPAYGVTTGLGNRSTFALPREELAEFSARTIRGRANAVGEPLPSEVVRAAVLARLNGIAGGGSGIQPVVARLLVDMLNAGVHPIVPEAGSIGSSDLCQSAHIGLVVIGEGRAELDGEILDGAAALRRAGLAPVRLGPKDGLVLCGASPFAAGHGALVVHDAAVALTLAQAVTALTFEGFRADVGPLDPRVQAVRPAPGQAEAARELLALLRGGDLAGRARRVQDPVSLRCAAQVHGSVHAALHFAWAALEPELNGSGDNPLVLVDGTGAGEIRSTGNFHTPALALAFDTLALALTQLSAVSNARMQRLLTPSLSGLPANLSPYGPERSGLAPLVKVAQALGAEIRSLSAPVSTDPRYGAEMVEDDSTSASLGARRLARALGLLNRLLAAEAVAAAQAVDLAREEAEPGVLGRGPAFLYEEIRRIVPRLDDDRPGGVDVERVAREVLGSPAVQRSLGSMADALL